MKKIKNIGLTAIILALVGMTTNVIQQNDYDTLIIGTWLPQDDGYDYRWVFTDEGKCYDYYDNVIDATYNYFISSNETESGRIHYSLKLINILDSSDIFEYSINGLGEESLHLEYKNGIGLSQLLFEKQ